MSHGRESGLRWVNRESNQDRSGCVGCRFKLEPVSVEMGSVHTHTHGEREDGTIYSTLLGLD